VDGVQVLSALGSVALIIGIGIGLVQLRGLRAQRQDELVIRAYSPFLDTALTRALDKRLTQLGEVHPSLRDPVITKPAG
jgi:hypothetical protein